jgi:hypothetical protein
LISRENGILPAEWHKSSGSVGRGWFRGGATLAARTRNLLVLIDSVRA